ncbi:MAG: hypothetical protein DMG24_02780 [Acidobacteria bacterium]|nr:MAG: hypothetical protein DMG24_02780 [Acidobacteriota bacterium]
MTRFISRRSFVSGSGALLAAFAIALCPGAAQAAKKKRKTLPAPPADLPGHVNYLARQLLGVPLDESDPITSQIQKLVVDHCEEWLGSRAANDTPSDVRVRRELERVFAQLDYPLYAWAATFAQPWKAGALIGAGYTLGWSDYDRVNVVALFETRQGKTRLAGLTHFVPHTDLHYEFLAPPPGGDFWFLVYGTRLGKSQPRLTAMLYSFDGHNLSALWELRDVYDGKISVGRNSIAIRYLKEDEYIRETAHGRKPPRYESIYAATPQGLELQSDHTIPF